MEKITQYPVYSRPAKLHHELPLEKHPSAQHMEQEQWFWWRLKFQPIGYNFVTSNAMKKLRNIWMPQKNNGIKLTSGPQHINSGQPDDMICSQGQRKNSYNGSPSLQKARCNKKKKGEGMRKLTPQWECSFRIIQVIKPSVYDLEYLNGKREPYAQNVQHLKRSYQLFCTFSNFNE